MKNVTLIKTLIIGLLLLTLTLTESSAQEKQSKKVESTIKKSKRERFNFQQFVMVSMKDRTEVPAVIVGRASNNQYWVRQFKGKRRGKVHRKYLRKMTTEEIHLVKNNTVSVISKNSLADTGQEQYP